MKRDQFCLWCQETINQHGINWFGAQTSLGGEWIHYMEAGQGPPLLLLHGFTGWSYTWRQNLTPLAQHTHVLAPDLRGFGLSEKNPARGHSLTDQVEVVRAFMDHHAIDRAVLCGHSMGGEIALRFALHYPKRVRALIIVTASSYVRYTLRRGQRLLLAIPALNALFIRLTVFNRRFAERALRFLYGASTSVEAQDILAYLLPARAPRAVATFLRILQDMDFGVAANLLHKISHPTLIIWGTHDPLIPVEHGKRLAAEVPHSRLLLMADCGHMVQEEQPEQFNAAVIQFLQTLPP